MAENILTPAKAANALRCEETDADMLALLPLVDAFIKGATGRDWTKDAEIYPQAEAAARMLLVRWHEDPGGMAAGSALGFGLRAILVQLKALALQLAGDGVPLEPLALVSTNIAGEMAVDASLVLVFNHEMSAGATNKVSLVDGAGSVVATANALDVTQRILTVDPDASLAQNTAYTLVLDHPADLYGQTLDLEIGFWSED